MSVRIVASVIATVVTLSVPVMAMELTEQQINTLPPAQVEAQLPQSHPAVYYLYAARRFKENKKNDAVFWFYVGQLRYRVLLKADLAGKATEEAPLFGALNATLGQTVNEYAGGDTKNWCAQIDRALAWDAGHSNPLTPKEKYKTDYNAIRAGLVKLRESIVSSADDIKKQRKENGLD